MERRGNSKFVGEIAVAGLVILRVWRLEWHWHETSRFPRGGGGGGRDDRYAVGGSGLFRGLLLSTSRL
jgi:hypothetical protein